MAQLIVEMLNIIVSGIIWCAIMLESAAIFITPEESKQMYIPKSKRKWDIGPMIDWVNKRFDEGASYLGRLMSSNRGSRRTKAYQQLKQQARTIINPKGPTRLGIAMALAVTIVMAL
jgi:hypothetical protein